MGYAYRCQEDGVRRRDSSEEGGCVIAAVELQALNRNSRAKTRKEMDLYIFSHTYIHISPSPEDKTAVAASKRTRTSRTHCQRRQTVAGNFEFPAPWL